MSRCLLSTSELHELESGECADPFTKLGFHQVETQGRTMGLIRVFNPAFRSVEIEHDGGVTACNNASGTGCFEALFPERRDFFAYRVRATLHAGETTAYDDAYAHLPVLTDYDLYLYNRGTHYQLWKKLGANFMKHQGLAGVHFAVWAPNARGLAVVGDFNGWNPRSHLMRRLAASGVWEIFVPGASPGARYKFLVHTHGGALVEKTDPLARAAELRPRTASVLVDPEPFAWKDQAWEAGRAARHAEHAPLSIYEVHLGSWRRFGGDGTFPTYAELSEHLVPYVRDLGYTHLELLPMQEHPLDESWGYQVTGYYAPTCRYGSPREFKAFIAACHQAGLGVILDWVPAHFPVDLHGLELFDGTQLYAHEDPRKGQHPEWGTRIFNYGRHEVSNFLLANALYWFEEFHLDGLRVDAVASMLYLDYARRPEEWEPNSEGGNINQEAVEFLKHLNGVVSQRHPHRLIIAEESSAFPGVTHALDHHGLGFAFKWNLGWMHDFLTYLSKDPVYRNHHQDLLTFEMSYAFSERFVLVLSHDEVVHGKGSLPRKMPGDDWQKFANLRAAFAYQYAHPGKKLNFMGLEFGQWSEWNVKGSLEWHLLDASAAPYHRGLQCLLRDLNRLYRGEKALHDLDLSYEGFQWIDFHDREQNVLSFLRRARVGDTGEPPETVVCIFNFSPVPRHQYRIGVPLPGFYAEILNTDSDLYSGGNIGNYGGKTSAPASMHHLPHSLELSLPPLGALYLRHQSQP